MISVLCPTRQRPDSVKRLLDSIAMTAATTKVEVVFRTDDDSPLDMNLAQSSRITEVRGPRITLSQMWNEAYAASRGEIVMQCGDDIVFRTHGWDERVRQEFAAVPDHIALVYGNDLLQGANLATHGFVHHTWVDTLGYFTPPYFSCDYGDAWLHELGVLTGRLRYMADVVTEHMHPSAGKALWDLSHQERMERGRQDNVAQLFEDRRPERERDAAKLRSVMTDSYVPNLTPVRMADTFDWCGPRIRDMIVAEFNQEEDLILDVGPCWGKYRILLPGWAMDACEAWEPYVREENLASMYRQVRTMDICDLVVSPQWHREGAGVIYDVVILGDVLEHIERPRATELVKRLLDTCGEVFVAVPYLNQQGPEHGNPYQNHRQADLTPEIMELEYPGLQLVDVEVRGGQPFKGIYRRR